MRRAEMDPGTDRHFNLAAHLFSVPISNRRGAEMGRGGYAHNSCRYLKCLDNGGGGGNISSDTLPQV